ncbi:unnamed protein product [Mycena citricolor]|uniref:Uncharacterized protein n=1 Tax=Mycena citricolor TaxID=2018698 RepID=A0AAD2H878_9AGAR|nr:unnamed protein product [Mycena citricolor]
MMDPQTLAQLAALRPLGSEIEAMHRKQQFLEIITYLGNRDTEKQHDRVLASCLDDLSRSCPQYAPHSSAMFCVILGWACRWKSLFEAQMKLFLALSPATAMFAAKEMASRVKASQAERVQRMAYYRAISLGSTIHWVSWYGAHTPEILEHWKALVEFVLQRSMERLLTIGVHPVTTPLMRMQIEELKECISTDYVACPDLDDEAISRLAGMKGLNWLFDLDRLAGPSAGPTSRGVL